MIATLALALSIAALAAAGALLVLARRASRGRRELAQSLHDRALALDQRCDALQRQLDAVARRQRADHLLDLVGVAERQGRLDAGRARRLERYALALRDEARRDPS